MMGELSGWMGGWVACLDVIRSASNRAPDLGFS